MNEQVQWYVTIAGNAVGPVSTDLVLRGIKHKKIATEAYVCVVGASEWQALTDVPEFHGALRENGLLPSADGIENHPANNNESASPQGARWSAPMASGEVLRNVEEDEETDTTAQLPSSRAGAYTQAGPVLTPHVTQGHEEHSEVTHVARLSSRPPAASQGVSLAEPIASPESSTASASDTDAPSHETAAVSEPPNDARSPVLHAREPAASIDIDIDVNMDEPEAPGIDWNHGFAEYFLVNADVTLPDEQLLLRSLATTPHETFVNDEPMWNLALCLAFGSNAVASVAADVFFDVVTAHALPDRLEWMARTLLSRGFMPSGIPHPAGNRGIGRLRQACPEEIRLQLESQLGI
jgi:hypothetical protein